MSDTTRRNFLKAGSTAAIGAAALSQLSSRAFAAGDDTVKIGLVGCGGRGTGAAAQALSTKGNVKLHAMGDAFRDQLDRSLSNIARQTSADETADTDVEEENKFVGFDAFKKVIDSGVDLVILATPPGFRPMMFEYAVEKGVNVFMEKPVATDAPGVRRVLEAARKAKEKNLKVGVGLQRHHQQQYIDLVGQIHNGDFGPVRALRVYWNGGGVWDPRKNRDEVNSEMEYQLRNWYYYNWLCGDHICEQHIHNLDIGNWIMGGFLDQSIEKNDKGEWVPQGWADSAIGMGGREVRTDKKYGEIFDHHAVQYTFSDGNIMISECRHIRGCWNSVTEHAHCNDAIVNLSSNTRACGVQYFDGKSEKYKGQAPNPYQVEHDDLFKAVRGGDEYSEANYGAMSTMTSILGRMCTYSGKQISMFDALNKGKGIMPEELGWDVNPPTLPDENGFYPVPVPGVTKVLEG